MQLTEIRINLCGSPNLNGNGGGGGARPARSSPNQGGRLRAFCSLTFDDTFVIRDVKLIDGNDGLFLAMPSRKLMDHCPGCSEKNHLRARFCNQCGSRLDEDRYLRYRSGNGHSRLKLHADIAHPINARTRQEIERRVFAAYEQEVERSHQPGYVAPNLDHEDMETPFDIAPAPSVGRMQPSVAAH
jgi:stage V sporulation protein G